MTSILLKNGPIFDGTGSDARPAHSLLIEDNKIAAVGPATVVQAPQGAVVVDASGKFIMPGMFNNHAHLGWDGARDRRYRALRIPIR